MKLIISAITWESLLQTGMKQGELIPLAKQLGCQGVEFRQYWQDLEAEVPLIRSMLEAERMVCTYACNEGLLAATREATEASLEVITGHIDVACGLGAKVLRINIAAGVFDEAFITTSWWQDAVRKVMAAAAAKNMLIAAENGPDQYKSKIQLVRHVLKTVNSPWLKLTYDTGNWLYAGEVPEDALSALEEQIGYVHLKDIIDKPDGSRGHSYLGTGLVDVRGLASKITARGYQGLLALEFPGGEDPVFRVKHSMQYLAQEQS
ncbi:sugar phosphate isomerase/epimerase [Anaerospora hongkongensis]|uniref:Sugar phosphate isomerase/epimerase n=1 Tax=Anaerospora hongkongensis TaxID=244830 RepID=A0A4R1Q1Y8_9FIRM|nr:sugar phosphate isomerase/epimerase family protein [Anaerospora hongkongensis]TCL34473.1 sugar phosphate isomerase/epimerase [Anaerospora hongkongensis]